MGLMTARRARTAVQRRTRLRDRSRVMATRDFERTSLSGRRRYGSDRAHVGGARALGALLDLVLDLGALGERLEAAAGDRGVVYEHVLALIVGRDEPKALFIAEPLHGSRSHRASG